MRKSSYTVVIGLILSFLISSCQTKEKKQETSELTFDSLKLSRVYYLDNDSTRPSCHLTISFTYPVEGLPENVLKKVQSSFISAMFDRSYADSLQDRAAECYADDYVKHYKEDSKLFDLNYSDAPDDAEVQGKANYYSYFELLTNEVLLNSASLLSFQVEQKNYKGGENSYTSYRNYVLDLRTGNQLVEDSIFVNGYEKPLREMLIDKLLKQNDVKNISDLEDLGYFGVEEILPNHNFFIDDKGLTYIYNKGESSALSMDVIRIHFAYKELEFILKPNSVLQPLIKD